jgi:hypothetical protein
MEDTGRGQESGGGFKDEVCRVAVRRSESRGLKKSRVVALVVDPSAKIAIRGGQRNKIYKGTVDSNR